MTAQLIHVGFLQADQPYETGTVADADRARIEHLILHTWQALRTQGWHNCMLGECGALGEHRAPEYRMIEGKRVMMGADVLFVPRGDVIYAAPSLIIHYIEAHGFRPPDVFLEALRAIDPETRDYRDECLRIMRAADKLPVGFKG